MYAERAYFHNEPCQHVADYHEHLRLEWLRRRTAAALANILRN